MHCRIQLLRPHQETKVHRHTCNTVFHVVSGHGVTKMGKARATETELAWHDRDCFNLPTWYWHRFKNLSAEPALLFSVSDRPLFEAIRLYREES